jgi:FMN-dependent NADH-azoreductase
MADVMHIVASPRAGLSESRAIADTFLDAYLQQHPTATVDTFDLWDGSLPQFGAAAAAAQRAVQSGAALDSDMAAAWASIRQVFDRFDDCSRYVFSVPMWNFGIPYVLKQFIDVVSQPGMLFALDPRHGYSGLLRDKKAAVIYTSAVYGPSRPPGFGADHQAPVFGAWLRWAGIRDIVEIHFRPNRFTSDPDTARQSAHAQAREAAKAF